MAPVSARHPWLRRLGLALLVASLAGTGAVSGCAADRPGPAAGESGPAAGQSGSPFRPCPAELATPRPTGQSRDPVPGGLTMIALPCFTGGGTLRVARLGKPTVVNLWASWCAPCRRELPELERLASRAGESLGVLGVVTEDRRSAAASLGTDLSITFPMLFDASGALRRQLAVAVLPVTLFLDAGGRVRHVDASGALTFAALAALVRTHLGVVIT